MKKELVIPVQHGLVAFMDILGFNSFLANNPSTYAAEIIIRVLDTIKEDMPEFASRFSGKLCVPADIFKDIETLVISDSFLVTLAINSGEDDQARGMALMNFLIYIMTLYRYLFDNGLPIRGAISSGEFITYESCFAGKPIVETYNFGNSLNLSAIAVSRDFSEEVYHLIHVCGYGPHHTLHDHLTPFTDGSLEVTTLLSPTICTLPYVGDIRELICKSFMAHKKQITGSALEKINNTETFFRYAQTLHSEAFYTPTNFLHAKAMAQQQKKIEQQKNMISPPVVKKSKKKKSGF